MISDNKLKEILLNQNYLDQDSLDKVAQISDDTGKGFFDALVSGGFSTRDIVGEAVAEYYKMPFVRISSKTYKESLLSQIPRDTAVADRIIVYDLQGNHISIATDDPSNPNVASTIQKLFSDRELTIAYALSSDVDEILLKYKKSIDSRFEKMIEGEKILAPETIDSIFDDALSKKASDIHLEPVGQDVIVRFRVDGVLHEVGTIAKKDYENILNLIKVRANLRIDEHYGAQDGSLRYVSDNFKQKVDMRVSIVPVLDGEKIVLRILAHYVAGFSLTDLGLAQRDQEILAKNIKKPFGMILTTGPTGAGKSTTLYALLKQINNQVKNVTTIEDPIEYRMERVNQIPVNQKTELTFAKGLRSILRQDPDVILVGEIRDDETAEIAVNAALTGHMMLSSFHANDASTALPRLLEMKVEPFLLASTIEVVLAQRLARKICTKCRTTATYSKEALADIHQDAEKIIADKGLTLYRGRGCDECGNSGYLGRTGLFELIEVTPEMKQLLLTKPSSEQIWELAKKQGTRSMFEDGLEKVKSGIVSIEELFRVASPAQYATNTKTTKTKKKTI